MKRGPDYWVESHLRHDFPPPQSLSLWRLSRRWLSPSRSPSSSRSRSPSSTRSWRHRWRRWGRRAWAGQIRAGRWLLHRLPFLRPHPSPRGAVLSLRVALAVLLGVALAEAILLVLAVQALRLSSGLPLSP